VVKHISDGTFGRVLEIQDIITQNLYACKILLPKEEIIKWWKFEKSLINEIMREDRNGESHCVNIIKDLLFVKNNVNRCKIIYRYIKLLI